MVKILLVEDDPLIGKSLLENLTSEGYNVTWSKTLTNARHQNENDKFDLMLLDLNLPDGLGLNLCQELRAADSRMPIIILTAKTDEESIINGLVYGANDYVKKPFGLGELMARIKVALREPMIREEQIRVGPLLILLRQNRILIDGVELHLNRREFYIFTFLAKNKEMVVSREQIIEKLNTGSELVDRTIDSHLSHIRKKIKKLGVTSVSITGVYGMGYKMEVT